MLPLVWNEAPLSLVAIVTSYVPTTATIKGEESGEGDTEKLRKYAIYDKEDVAGLLEDRLTKAKERLEDALEQVRALCEPVQVPKNQPACLRYFSSKESGNAAQLKTNEPQRPCCANAIRVTRKPGRVVSG